MRADFLARKRANTQRPSVLAGSDIANDVVRRVVDRCLSRIDASEQRLDALLYELVYQEERRLAHAEANPQAQADHDFLRSVRRGLARGDAAQVRGLLRAAVARYAREISGFFDLRVYGVATRVLPPALAALMHGVRPGPELFRVQDRILIEGETRALAAAIQRGTVVLVPTHVSNLDSLILGYVIFALGLPPFAYGAGLNLFANPLTRFFMRNLGAFTVDRQKSCPVYRATLKEYMTLLLERGQHVLFFPGGTRSRAGDIESHLKLGLLGTAVTAFSNLVRGGRARPISIVPCTLSYPLVLEASSLVADYLRQEGRSRYLELGDEFERPARWYDFLRRLSQLDLQVHVRFGRPLDILGHPIDQLGASHGPGGHPLDPARYLWAEGRPIEDAARDAQYTQLLAQRVLQSYRELSTALPSSVLAFSAFERLRARFPQLDVFRLLRALADGAVLDLNEVRGDVDLTLGRLRALAAEGALALAPELGEASAQDVITRGAATLSSYHRVPALSFEQGQLRVRDPALLFYYRNRLDGYGLLGAPTLAELVAQRGDRRAA